MSSFRFCNAVRMIPCFALAISLIWWRGPDWHLVRGTFAVVSWPWIVLAVALNLLSVVVRAAAWNTVFRQPTSASTGWSTPVRSRSES